MVDIIAKKTASPNTCAGCPKPLGDEAKVHGVSVAPADGGGSAANTNEVWCPTCFVYHRAQLEPGRWPRIAPAKCSSCGFEVLLHGHANKCPNCRSRAVVLLSRPAALLAKA